jgi:hypothetical protein
MCSPCVGLFICASPHEAMTLETLPESCFPASEFVDKLASQRAKAVKQRVLAPFPLVDLVESQPSWCGDTVVNVASTKKKGKLDMVRWVASFQAYAVAADAAGVSFLCLSALAQDICMLLPGLEICKRISTLERVLGNCCGRSGRGAAPLFGYYL